MVCSLKPVSVQCTSVKLCCRGCEWSCAWFPFFSSTQQHHRYLVPSHLPTSFSAQWVSRAQSPVPFFPTLAATNRVCEPLQAQEVYASWRLFVMDWVTQVTWAQRKGLQFFYSNIHKSPSDEPLTQLALNRNFIWNGEMSRRAHRAKPQKCKACTGLTRRAVRCCRR